MTGSAADLSRCDSVSVSLQSLTSALMPPNGEQLAAYLDTLTAELGERSDAGLARLMGIQPSTIANWRRRGVVAQPGMQWLEEELVSLLSVKDRVQLRSGTMYLNGVLRLLRDTGGDLFEVGEGGAADASGLALPALFSMARVILRGPLASELHSAPDDECEARLANLLRAALPSLRQRLRIGLDGPQ